MSVFFKLPRELRDEVYLQLLQEESLFIGQTGSLGASHCCIWAHHCLMPTILRINKQIKTEYSAIAYDHTYLEISYVFCPPESRAMTLPNLPTLSSLPGIRLPMWPLCAQMTSLVVQISCHITENSFSKITGLDQLVADLPALRTLDVTVSLDAENMDDFLRPEMDIPSLEDLVTLPLPAGRLTKVIGRLEITTWYFRQNRGHLWTDALESRIVGEMAMHKDNLIRMVATPSRGPYTWRGLDLQWEDGMTWDALRKKCVSHPMTVNLLGPYVT